VRSFLIIGAHPSVYERTPFTSFTLHQGLLPGNGKNTQPE